jgi:hypothetical protein
MLVENFPQSLATGADSQLEKAEESVKIDPCHQKHPTVSPRRLLARLRFELSLAFFAY